MESETYDRVTDDMTPSVMQQDDQQSEVTAESRLSIPDVRWGRNGDSSQSALDPTGAVTQYLADLVQTTMDWAMWGSANREDPQAVEQALQAVNTNLTEIQKHAELQQAVVGGLKAALDEAVAQRDELVRETEDLKLDNAALEDEVDDLQCQLENPDEEIIYDIEQAAIQAHEEDFEWAAQSTSQKLRQAGKEGEAEEVDKAFGLARQSREEAEDLIQKHGAALRAEERRRYMEELQGKLIAPDGVYDLEDEDELLDEDDDMEESEE